MHIPIGGEYIWNWYHDLNSWFRRVSDGVCFPLGPDDFFAWAKIKGEIVKRDEYAILHAVDLAFCEEMNKELQAYHERERERQKQEVEAARRTK